MGWFNQMLAVQPLGPGASTVRLKGGVTTSVTWNNFLFEPMSANLPASNFTWTQAQIPSFINSSSQRLWLDSTPNYNDFWDATSTPTTNQWQIPISPGLYDVVVYASSNDGRVADFTINNIRYQNRRELSEQFAGLARARFIRINSVPTVNGDINMSFNEVLNNTTIQAIEILPPGTPSGIPFVPTSPVFSSAPFATNNAAHLAFNRVYNESVGWASATNSGILGYDFGVPQTIGSITYTPRPGNPSRTQGRLWASNDKYHDYVQILEVPSLSTTTTFNILQNLQGPWRYIKHISIPTELNNFLEMEIFNNIGTRLTP